MNPKDMFSSVFIERNKKKIGRLYVEIVNISFPLALIPILWFLIFFIAPLFVILKTSFVESVFGIPPYTEVFVWAKDHFLNICLNFHNYFILLKNAYYREAFVNSILLSSCSTILCLIIGYIMAYGIFQMRTKHRNTVLLLISMSLWTSSLVRIYAWMNLLSISGLLNSILIKLNIIDSPIKFLGNYYVVCMGMVFCYLPFMILPIYSSMTKIDKACIEAAIDLAANTFKTFREIIIPITKYGIIAGCILVFTTTMGEFVIPELLGGPNTVNMGRILWMEFFNNIDFPMACTLSVALVVLIIFPVYYLQKGAGKELEIAQGIT
jgi:putrescine transport system permease protein